MYYCVIEPNRIAAAISVETSQQVLPSLPRLWRVPVPVVSGTSGSGTMAFYGGQTQQDLVELFIQWAHVGEPGASALRNAVS